MDHYLRLLQRQATSGSTEDLQRYIHALEQVVGGGNPLPPLVSSDEWPEEAIIQTIHGTQLRCPAFPNDVDYLRVCDDLGNEIAYWSVDEWRNMPLSGPHYEPGVFGVVEEVLEDGQQGSMEVIGAIAGALLGGAIEQSEPCAFPNDVHGEHDHDACLDEEE